MTENSKRKSKIKGIASFVIVVAAFLCFKGILAAAQIRVNPEWSMQHRDDNVMKEYAISMLWKERGSVFLAHWGWLGLILLLLSITLYIVDWHITKKARIKAAKTPNPEQTAFKKPET